MIALDQEALGAARLNGGRWNLPLAPRRQLGPLRIT